MSTSASAAMALGRRCAGAASCRTCGRRGVTRRSWTIIAPSCWPTARARGSPGWSRTRWSSLCRSPA
eukprot:2107993-Pyramimonas_sp.AAC.1